MTKEARDQLYRKIAINEDSNEIKNMITNYLKGGHLTLEEASYLNEKLDNRMINHSIKSLTERINKLSKYGMDKDEIKKEIKKEMGNFYNSSRLCFTIEESIDLIYSKLEEDWEKYGKPSWYDPN